MFDFPSVNGHSHATRIMKVMLCGASLMLLISLAFSHNLRSASREEAGVVLSAEKASMKDVYCESVNPTVPEGCIPNLYDEGKHGVPPARIGTSNIPDPGNRLWNFRKIDKNAAIVIGENDGRGLSAEGLRSVLSVATRCTGVRITGPGTYLLEPAGCNRVLLYHPGDYRYPWTSPWTKKFQEKPLVILQDFDADVAEVWEWSGVAEVREWDAVADEAFEDNAAESVTGGTRRKIKRQEPIKQLNRWLEARDDKAAESVTGGKKIKTGIIKSSIVKLPDMAKGSSEALP